MFSTCKDLFDTSSSDDNSFYGFSKEELNMASKSRSGRKLSSPTAISVVTSSTATSTSSSCTVTSSSRLRLRSLKLAESQSEPLVVQQDSGPRLVDSYFSKGSIPSVSSSSLVDTIHPGSSVIATPTVMPTFGSQDRLRSEPVSSYSVRQDGAQLRSNQRRHDGFVLLSSRPSRQINSGDRLERLEQVVESIALRLGLLVDDDEANVFDQGNQHGGRSPESEDYSFSDGYAQEEQDSQNKRKIPASDLDEHEEVSVPPTKFRKVDGNSDGEPVVDSDIIFRPREKDTQRWSIQDVVSDYTLKYFNSVLNEESFQEISKDIGKPDNDLLAPPVLNDIIKKADQVITNKGLLHGDEVIYRCQDHLLTGVFPLLKLWQSVREGVELNEEVFLGSIQRSIVCMGSAFSGLSSYRRHRFKQVLSEKYSSLLLEPVTPSHFLFGDNLHDKLKKISEEQKLIKQASSVLGKNMSNNTRNFRKRSRSSQNKFQRSGSDRRRIILRNKYQKNVNFQTKYKQKKENP